MGGLKFSNMSVEFVIFKYFCFSARVIETQDSVSAAKLKSTAVIGSTQHHHQHHSLETTSNYSVSDFDAVHVFRLLYVQ